MTTTISPMMYIMPFIVRPMLLEVTVMRTVHPLIGSSNGNICSNRVALACQDARPSGRTILAVPVGYATPAGAGNHYAAAAISASIKKRQTAKAWRSTPLPGFVVVYQFYERL
jgi:hypothetical protein